MDVKIPDKKVCTHVYYSMCTVGQSVALNFTPPCQNDQFWSDPASNPYTPTLIPQNE